MKNFWQMLLCLTPLVACAQQSETVQERVEASRLDTSVPPAVIDADGTYVQYKAELSDGKTTLILGRYLNAAQCLQRLDLSVHSEQFKQALRERPILELACVALRQPA